MLAKIRFAVCVALASSACTYSYQPMSGLHRPFVVDMQQPNLADVRLEVVCVPGDLLSRSNASTLCNRLRTLFEQQGAIVATTLGEPVEFEDSLGPSDPANPVAERLDLRLELRAREEHRSFQPWSWLAFAFTFTLAPGTIESTFSQDIVLRDGTGFLLGRERMTGRIVEQYGAGAWAVSLAETRKRPKGDRKAQSIASQELSTDMYRRLSQTVFDARMRATVLREASAGVGR